MYKFLKSKKGFTLVELMIVVVIMAILVAVAVPIYNSVTARARSKTCADNRRQIISSLNTWFMSNPRNVGGSYTIVTNADGESATYGEYTGGSSGISLNPDEYQEIKDLFEFIPFCPDKSSVITVKFIPNANGEGAYSKIEVECSNHGK